MIGSRARDASPTNDHTQCAEADQGHHSGQRFRGRRATGGAEEKLGAGDVIGLRAREGLAVERVHQGVWHCGVRQSDGVADFMGCHLEYVEPRSGEADHPGIGIIEVEVSGSGYAVGGGWKA